MKKIVIVGAGYDQLEAIEVARQMGIYTISVDRNRNAPGASFSDEFHNISTLDYEGLVQLCRERGVDGITTVASESSIPVIARVAATLGLPGISEETAILATNKARMKDRLIQHNVSTPKFDRVSELSQLSKFLDEAPGPWVLKPTDSSGQRGIVFGHAKSEILSAFEDAKKFATDNVAVVEQYVEGPEINVCGYVKGGQVKVLSIANRVTDKSNFGIAIEHVAPSVANHLQKRELASVSQRIAEAIGLENGLIYPQFILGNEGVHLIEVAARMPGGNNREMAMYLSGVDMIKVAIMLALDMPFEHKDLIECEFYENAQVKFITRNSISTDIKRVSNINGLDEVLELPTIKKVFMNLQAGDEIPPLNNSTARFGGVVLAGDNLENLKTDLEVALKTIEIC